MKRRICISIIVSLLIVLVYSSCSNTASISASIKEQVELGNKYLQEGKYEEALLAFQKAIEIEPKNTGAYAGLGLAHANSGDYGKAIETIDNALSIGLENSELLHEAKVKIYLKKNDIDGAKAYLGSISDQKILDYLKEKFSDLYSNIAEKQGNSSRKFKNQVVKFIDPCFEKAMRVLLDKPQGDIWSDELAEISNIVIYGGDIQVNQNNIVSFDDIDYGVTNSNRSDGQKITYGGIKSLNDLIWFTGLTQLMIIANQVSDIGILANLTNLTYLNLNINQINDIGDISSLANLSHLFLGTNQIKDISAVAELKNLTYLGLDKNQISDINALAGLTNLTNLNLIDNNISNINAISRLTGLTWLGLDRNQINDISALSGLTNIKGLYLWRNPISDYTPALKLPNLDEDSRKSIKSLIDNKV